MDPIERFKKKLVIDPSTGCWLWRASLSNKGYGRFRLGKKVITASRAAYLLFRGPIAEGLEPDHLCRVRRCANPDHLELVTHQVNTQRGWNAQPWYVRKLACPHGHPYSGYNLGLYKGTPYCKECKRLRIAGIRRVAAATERQT